MFGILEVQLNFSNSAFLTGRLQAKAFLETTSFLFCFFLFAMYQGMKFSSIKWKRHIIHGIFIPIIKVFHQKNVYPYFLTESFLFINIKVTLNLKQRISLKKQNIASKVTKFFIEIEMEVFTAEFAMHSQNISQSCYL